MKDIKIGDILKNADPFINRPKDHYYTSDHASQHPKWTNLYDSIVHGYNRFLDLNIYKIPDFNLDILCCLSLERKYTDYKILHDRAYEIFKQNLIKTKIDYDKIHKQNLIFEGYVTKRDIELMCNDSKIVRDIPYESGGLSSDIIYYKIDGKPVKRNSDQHLFCETLFCCVQLSQMEYKPIVEELEKQKEIEQIKQQKEIELEKLKNANIHPFFKNIENIIN